MRRRRHAERAGDRWRRRWVCSSPPRRPRPRRPASVAVHDRAPRRPGLRLRPPHRAARPDRRDPRHRHAFGPPQASRPPAPRHEAVVALAGGPGQAALPFATDSAQVMALGARDARPGRLRPARHRSLRGAQLPGAQPIRTSRSAPGSRTARTQIGATRGLYTTDDSVADIEAIRKALGYTKLVLYGTSYGTKVALRYAAAVPEPRRRADPRLDGAAERTRRLRASRRYAAVPRILAQLCAASACPGDHERPAGRPDNGPHTARRAPRPHARRRTRRLGPQRQARAQRDLQHPRHWRRGRRSCARTCRQRSTLQRSTATTGCSRTLSVIANQPERWDQQRRSISRPAARRLPFPWNRADPTAQRASEALAASPRSRRARSAPFSAKTAYDESAAPTAPTGRLRLPLPSRPSRPCRMCRR